MSDISDRELAEAVHLVRNVYACAAAEDVSALVVTETLRLLFSRRWPHWSDRELELALRAALVVH